MLTPEHRDYLAAQAVDVALAEKLGVRSLTSHADNVGLPRPFDNWANFPAILFPWTSEDGRVEYQVRPDNPTSLVKGGRPRKYVFRKGAVPVLWAVRPMDDATEVVLIVEGTKQALSAASYAPEGVAVYGIAGCRTWQKDGEPIPDLAGARGMDVVICLDADASHNDRVYDAGIELAGALKGVDAASVAFTRLGPAAGDEKAGLDDVLAELDVTERTGYLLNAIEEAKADPADRRPKDGAAAEESGLTDRLKALGLSGDALRHALELHSRAEAQKALRRLEMPPADPPSSVDLAALLAEPDEETPWRVEGLIPSGANALVVAQAKAGKTTLVGNLIRSVVDWESFLTEGVEGVGNLGKVTPLIDGQKAMVVDLELDRRTIRRWFRDQRITNTGAVLVESLRGRIGVFDIKDPERRAAWAKHLIQRDVKVLVIDCLGPLLAHYGADENSNTEVGQVLAAMESLKLEAGVEELILVHHAGHNGERTRGASRLRDWPDVEVRLMIEGSEDPRYEPAPDAPRYIAARGRDVSIRERKLAFNGVTRRLTLAAEGGNRAQVKSQKQREMLLDKLKKRPGSSQRELVGTNNALRNVLQELIEEGLVHTWAGKGKSIDHALAVNCPGRECSRQEAHQSG
jgi:hypothetical protein